MKSNQITGPNAGGPRQLPIRTSLTAPVGQFWRSALVRHTQQKQKSMKTNETLKTTNAEETFSVALIIGLLVILPLLGGTAILAGASIGLVAYGFFFRERLRSRGWLKSVAVTAVIAVLATTIVVAVSVSRGHLY
jgi:hypothetical protein